MLPQRNRIAFCRAARANEEHACTSPATTRPEWRRKSSTRLAKANTGYALGYGNDDWTKRVEQRFAEMFEKEVAVFLVPTGTAANALAIAHLSPPWGAVLCHEGSHIATDECGAPEFFGGGLKLIGLQGEGAKISAATLRGALEGGQWGGPHHVIAERAVALAGDRMRHDLSRRRDEGACRHRAQARHDGAHGWRAARQCAGAHECLARGGHLEGRRRCALVRRHQGRRDGGGSGDLLRCEARRRDAEPPQARRRARLEAPLHRGADGGVPRRRSVDAARAPRQRDGGRACRRD